MSKVAKRRTTATCIICNSTWSTECEEEKLPANQNKFFIQSFCAHFGIPLPFRDANNKLIDWNFHRDSDETLPFCLSCKDTAEGLIPLDEQLKSLESAINSVENKVKKQILESHHRTSSDDDDSETSNGVQDPRIKLIRNFILGPLLSLSKESPATTTTITSRYKRKPPVKHQTKPKKSSPIKLVDLVYLDDDDDWDPHDVNNDDDFIDDEPIRLPALEEEDKQNGQVQQQHNLRKRRNVSRPNRYGYADDEDDRELVDVTNDVDFMGDDVNSEPIGLPVLNQEDEQNGQVQQDNLPKKKNKNKGWNKGLDDEDFDIEMEAEPRKKPYTSKKPRIRYSKPTDGFKRKNVHLIKVHKKKETYTYAGFEFVGNDEDRYRCSLCPDKKTYSRKNGAIHHIRNIHIDDERIVRTWLCDTCGKGFKRSNDLAKHVQIHAEDQGFICHACGGSYKSEFSLQSHVRYAHSHGNDHFTCSYEGCRRVFTSERKYLHHVRADHKNIPREELPSKIQFCPYCPSSYVRKQRMAGHIRKFHSEEAKAAAAALVGRQGETDDNNDSQIQDPASTSAALEMVRDFVPILPYKGPTAPKTHRRRGVRTTKPELEFYQCKVCAVKYKTWRYLRHHELVAHNLPKLRVCNRKPRKSNGLQENNDNEVNRTEETVVPS